MYRKKNTVMRKILIPTDFTVWSLNILKEALAAQKEERIDILLVHGAYLSTSITDLLFFNKHKFLDSLQSNDFRDALKVLENKFDSNINSLEIDLFSGYNNSAFKDFFESRGVTEAFVPSNYVLVKAHKKSFDLLPCITKMIPTVKKISMDDYHLAKERHDFSEANFLNILTS